MFQSGKYTKLAALCFPLSCCLGGGLLRLFAYGGYESRLAAQVAEARRSGLAVEYEDLPPVTRPPAPPQGENPYEKLAAFQTNEDYVEARRKLRGNGRQRTAPVSWNQIEHAVQTLKAGLVTAEHVSHMSGGYWVPLDEDTRPFLKRHLNFLVGAAQDLRFCADWEDRAGNSQDSLADIGTSYRLLHKIAVDPHTTSLVPWPTYQAVNNQSLVRMVQRHRSDPQFLGELGKIVQAVEPPPSFRTEMGAIAVEDRLLMREALSVRQFVFKVGGRPNEIEDLAFRDEKFKASLDSQILTNHLEVWKAAKNSALPWVTAYQQYVQKMKRLEQDHSLRGKAIHGLLALDAGTMRYMLVNTCNQNMIATGIGLLRTYDETGKLPRSIPSSLGKNAMDPFTGRPLRYQKTSRGFKLSTSFKDPMLDHAGLRRPSHIRMLGMDTQLEITLPAR